MYLWLRLEGELVPYYYVLSWDQKEAERLRSLLREQKPGQKLMIKKPYLRYWSESPFYLVDISPLAPKDQEESEVLYYNPEQQP